MTVLSRGLRVFFLATVAAIAALGPGCSSDAPPPGDPTAGVPDGCDPLVPEHCGYPFPNDFWLVGEGASRHIAFGANTLPLVNHGTTTATIDPNALSDRDGFSPGEEALTFLPGATVTGLATPDTIERSLQPDSPTVLIEADTGALVPHWAELDQSTFHPDDQALMIRPVVRLKDDTRYIVAVRHVVDADGAAIPARPAFAALRDKTPTTSAALEARRDHFEDIFARLAAAGVARQDLQIAWDYTTATRDNTTGDLVAMRDAALAAVGDQGPEYTITSVETAPNQYLAARLHGMMTVPLFLDSPDPGDDVHIHRGPDGKPQQNGTAQYPFLVLVPKSATAANPAAILQNGHGLLGALTEGEDGYFAEMCGTYNYVGIAVDWIGMAHDDIQTNIDAATVNPLIFKSAVARQHQGFVNALLAMRMMKGRMKDDPNLQDNGKTILDPTQAFYRGDSQGGIFGTTYMSISTDVTRGLLGEPGMPYNLLLDRSADFSGYKLLLKGAYPNGLDVRLVEGLLQILWDKTEPDGYVPYLAENMLPGTPAHRVLIDVAIGDHQVTPLGAHIIARTVGAKNISPVNRKVYGIDEAAAPISDGSAMAEYDFGLPKSPIINLPPHDGEDPHDKLRYLPQAMQQADDFFRTGTFVNHCNGPCTGQ